jgi:protein KRI1
LTIKQHALNAILDPDESRTPSPAPNTYVKDQELLKKETILAFKEAVASDSDDDELLVSREKTRDEIEQEEEEYREFLEREVGQIADIKELITVEEGVERVHVEGEGDTSMPRKKDKKKKKGKAKEDIHTEQSDKDFLLKCASTTFHVRY